MNRKMIILVGCIIATMLTGCGEKYTCGMCGKEFRGTAYTDMEATSIYCDKCATQYWNPFPISEHKYLGD